VAGIVGSLVSRAARRTAEAARARSDAASLAAMAALTAGVGDQLPLMVGQVRAALGAAGAAVLHRLDGSDQVLASDGVLEGTPITAPIDETTELALFGVGIGPADQEVLTAFSSQITTALDQQRLRSEAARSEQLAEVNELRASLLAAVSHDLRTPLAAIKASVSSLRQNEIEWPQEVEAEFLATIEGQTDRLTDLVSNLLGMSRIQSGAVQLSRRDVGVDDVVSAAIAGLDLGGVEVVVDIGEDLAPWHVDPALAERVVANLIDNAAKWSTDGGVVRLTATEHDDSITLAVIDSGPGIPADRRDQVFEPFQRLGDGTVGGTGLGLAVARGLTNVLGGRLEIDDTPGGGTTMSLTLEAAT
jgi:two-component system sensor histidine kinase KdpD